MKKILRFSLLALLMTVFNGAWAEDVTVSMSSFTAISGNVGGDSNISYEAAKGGASTAPAVNNNEIRVYQNGGTFTVSAKNGAKIKSVTLGSSMATTVTYSVDKGTASDDQDIDANGTITIEDLDCSSILFTCTGTDKTHRLYVNYLSVTYTPPTTQTVATPTFDPAGGEYSEAKSVTIGCETAGASIYYTTNGSTPTVESTPYSDAITVNETTTIKAIAVKEGMNNSVVATATYTIIQAVEGYTIDFESPALAYVDWTFTNMESMQSGSIGSHSGNYYGTTGGKATASITTKEKIATLNSLTCYVSKQSTNTSASTWEVQVSADGTNWETVKSRSAYDMEKGNWEELTANLSSYSDVYVRIYYSGSTAVRNIDDLTLDTSAPAVATPTFSPAGGEYSEAQSVTISCETAGASIYYTTDGSEPTNESTPYSGAITVSETTTIKAIAYVGTDASAVATATYTIVDPNGPGTANNPYTVEQARAAIDAGTGVTGVYAKGIVSEIVTAYNSQYGNITYNISADGTTSAVQLQAYRGKSYNGDNFTSEDDIQVGDEVVIFGNLTKYNQIYEFAQDNQLVSLVRKPSVAEITTDLTELEMGTPIRWEDFTITYAEGVDEDDVEVDYDVEGFQMDLDQGLLPEGAETASITFTFTYVGEGNYSDVEKTFTFNVVDNRPDPAFAFTYVSDNSNVADWNPEDGLVLGGELGTANIVVWYNSPIYDTDWKSSNALLTVTVVDELPTGVTYRKVTSTDELTDGKYLIVYEDGNVAFDGSLTELDASGNHQEVTITDDEIVTDAAIYFTLDVTAGTIQSASGYYIGITGGSNGLGQSVDAEAYTNTFSFNEGKAVIVSGNNMTLSYNSDSNQKRFRYFKNGGQKPIALYKEVVEEPEVVTVTISASTYATFYYSDKAFEIPEGITASAVVRDGSSLSEIPVENVIPAGCPVLLHGAAGEYEFVETTEEGVMPTANSLIGSEEGGTYNEAGYKYYVLSWRNKNKNPEEVGFYYLSGSKGAYAKVKAHQAYMRVVSTQANEAGYVIGETTGITSIAADGTDSTAPMYNLAGQRVNDSFRGVVIQNGKKTIKK